MDLDNVTWRKASYSGDNGGGCVEVGVWRKATYSGGNGGACIEVGTWHKASHSGANGGDCVEVAARPDALVAVRDSKDPAGPALTFSASDWHTFITRATLRWDRRSRLHRSQERTVSCGPIFRRP